LTQQVSLLQPLHAYAAGYILWPYANTQALAHASAAHQLSIARAVHASCSMGWWYCAVTDARQTQQSLACMPCWGGQQQGRSVAGVTTCMLPVSMDVGRSHAAAADGGKPRCLCGPKAVYSPSLEQLFLPLLLTEVPYAAAILQVPCLKGWSSPLPSTCMEPSRPSTTHRNMLVLSGSAPAAVRLFVCLPLLVRPWPHGMHPMQQQAVEVHRKLRMHLDWACSSCGVIQCCRLWACIVTYVHTLLLLPRVSE
jgi:hypothetical protein